jgi:dipeptide/tripeptide permease
MQYSAWSGFAYITPLLGGYIADTYLGRYKTIIVCQKALLLLFFLNCNVFSLFLFSCFAPFI